MKIKQVVLHRLARKTIAIPNGRSTNYETIEVGRDYTVEEATPEEIKRLSQQLFDEVERELEKDVTDIFEKGGEGDEG